MGPGRTQARKSASLPESERCSIEIKHEKPKETINRTERTGLEAVVQRVPSRLTYPKAELRCGFS